MQDQRRSKVVIVGAGFGGLNAALELARTDADVTVIDRRNFHLFQPLLYQVATASLSPAEISAPIRSVLRHQRNAGVVLDKVVDVDVDGRRVLTEGGNALPYDYLVIATGARHSYFGHDEWAEVAPGIKTIDDATWLRSKILLAFERAETETDAAKREALLTFVIVGAGPTGVEVAGAIAELARHSITRDFRKIRPGDARTILVESGPRILAQFREDLSAAAHRALVDMGVEIRTGHAVTDITGEAVRIGETEIVTPNVIWAAGVKASPAGRWLNAETDRAGRVKVGSDFSLPGHEEIFVIGDTALFTQESGKPVPGVAPAAKQAGRYVASVIAARVAGKPAPGPFRYKDFGNLATVGRKFAVIDLHWLRLTGFVAWLIWGVAHVWYLIGFRNRFVVAASWLWSYITWQRGVRLITGREVALADEPARHAA